MKQIATKVVCLYENYLTGKERGSKIDENK